MTARAFLAELRAAGIRLGRDGADLIAEVRPGADLAPFRDHILAHKPALVAALRGPVEATEPPAGWQGATCDGCRWERFCSVLGPRGPHLDGGPCPAWPAAEGGQDAA